MKLKGDYNPLTDYDVEDVVRFQNAVYHLQHPCPAGVPPVDTLYWGRTSQIVEDIVNLCMDAVDMANAGDLTLEDDLTQSTAGKKALDAHQGKVLKGLIDALVIPDNINDEAITLKGSGDNEFLITVDDSGETPELSVTLIEPQEEETPSEGGES